VASDGSRGGFKGETSGACLSQKFQLLRDEGVPFTSTDDSWSVDSKAILGEDELRDAIIAFAKDH